MDAFSAWLGIGRTDLAEPLPELTIIPPLYLMREDDCQYPGLE